MIELPQKSGAYRWLYLDATIGDLSAVVIFMIGNIFSPRYSVGARRGSLPVEFSAVNFVLYDRGARWCWVLTEYPTAQVHADREALCIGSSCWWRHADGRMQLRIVDSTAVWRKPVEAHFEIIPDCEPGPAVQLVEGQPHWWQPIAPRAQVRVRIPQLGLDSVGMGYHDGNHGDEPLGGGISGWRWVRAHVKNEARIVYEPHQAPSWHVSTRGQRVEVEQRPEQPLALRRTGWGLRVPSDYRTVLGDGGGDARVLESSPFYARLEAGGVGSHALGEVADFRRFHRPSIRWMANFRTRVAQESV